jgi:uncharacterized protein with ParB-like and HNH nuclease domain
MEENLFEYLASKRSDYSSENVKYSVGEIIRMYEKERLFIQPNYQRYFRWDIEQKTDFIESLLLRLPIPPIFIYKKEQKKLTYEVLDGLQRIATILEFTNSLKENIKSTSSNGPLKLGNFKILTKYNNMNWKDFKENDLDFAFEQSSLLFTIISTSANEKFETNFGNMNIKYEIFRRLNTNISPLSNQEIRNAILQGLMSNIFNKIDEKLPKILESYLPNSYLEQRKDVEIFIEFSLIKNFNKNRNLIEKSNDLSEILNYYIYELTKEQLETEFNEFIDFIKLSEEHKFKRFYSNEGTYRNTFIQFFFETCANIYFMDKNKLKNYNNYFNRSYADIIQERKTNNPNAKIRFLEAKRYAEDIIKDSI